MKFINAGIELNVFLICQMLFAEQCHLRVLLVLIYISCAIYWHVLLQILASVIGFVENDFTA